MNKGAELFLDVRKLNVSDVAAVLVEERRSRNSERIKPYDTWIGADGSTPFAVGLDTELKRREMAGVKSVQELARLGHQTIVWISPPGGMSQYSESRMIVYEVLSVEVDKVNFRCTAICGQQSEDRCVQIANDILNDGGDSLLEVVKGDDLRAAPIALPRSEGVNWVNYLERVMPGMGDVWEAIREGRHFEGAAQAGIMAEIIVRQYQTQAAKVSSKYEAIVLGAMMERDIRARFNVSLMSGGVHGSSNEAMLKRGAFDATFQVVVGEVDKNLQVCNRCGNYYIKRKEKCPNCI